MTTWNTHRIDDSLSVETRRFPGTEKWCYAVFFDGHRHENSDDTYDSEGQALEAGTNEGKAQRRMSATRG